MSVHARNLELKIQVPATALDAARERVLALSGQPLDRMRQVDTYVHVPRGRLKLREIRQGDDPATIIRAELIAYARPQEAGSRWSTYLVVPVAASDAARVLAALELTHDVQVRVEKEREVGIIGQTRVHLDRVERLGMFIELETVIAGQSEDAAQAEHRQVIAALGLDPARAIAGSYADLLLKRDADI